jgi:hypothetical protein
MANRNKIYERKVITTAKPLNLGINSTQSIVECQYKSSHEKHDRERLLAVSMAYENSSTESISVYQFYSQTWNSYNKKMDKSI